MSLLGLSAIALGCAPQADHPPYTSSDKGEVDEVRGNNNDDETAPSATSEASGTSEPSGATEPSPPGLTIGTLSEWVGPTIWTNLQRMMVAGSDGAVYVTDGARVYQVIDGEPKALLSAEMLEIDTNDEVIGLSVDNQNQIHVFIEGFQVSGEERVFSAAGEPVSQRSVTTQNFMGMPTTSPEGNEAFYLTGYGLHRSVGDTDELFYDRAALGGDVDTTCASETLLVGPQHIYYMPGCNSSPLLMGTRDGSAFGKLKDDEPIDESVEQESGFITFQGITNHPNGGVIANMELRLVWVKDDGTWDVFVTTPSMDDDQFRTTGFHASPVATDGSNIYLLSDSRIWIVEGLLEQ